jgi:SpoVK/Ycf46/Vps4 family AAA+-type ATPase
MKREPLAAKVEIPEDRLTPFFREIADRFLSRQSNVFFLTGNVNDLLDGLGVSVSLEDENSPDRYCYLEKYIASRLEAKSRLVIMYNIARGINFTSNDQFNRLRDFYSQYDTVSAIDDPREQEKRAARFDRSVVESQVYSFLTLRFLEELCRITRKYPDRAPGSITILMKHADTILPDSPLPSMPDIDRQKLTLLTEWFTDPEFIASNEQVILIAPTEASIHSALRTLPHTIAVNVPLPDATQRQAFIGWMNVRTGRTVKMKDSGRELPSITAGMTLLTLQNLFLQARHRGNELSEKDILEALNRLLVSELGDKIEMVKPSHSMDDVIGAAALKKELARLRTLIETRDPKVCPVGILVPGPNGVGKTFIFEAWAAELDRVVIVLKNLRSMYFGQTDQIFEKLRNVLEVLGNVVIFIDEADTMFGKPGRDTHETEARLFGNLIRMMGEPKNRGRIIWILLTARPDNLAPDLKRSGRAGLHLSIFDPEGDDRRAYIDSVLKRAAFDPATLTPEQRTAFETATAELSPADFNEVLVELRAERAIAGKLTFEQIQNVIGNIMPGQIAAQRRIQTLNAFLECSRKSLIPTSLAGLNRLDAENEVEELRGRMR